MSGLEIDKVYGSVNSGTNNVNNILHPTHDTRYSSKGLGSYFDIELKKKQNIGGISIGFYAGDKRKIKFTVASTEDFKNFKLVQTFASSGNSNATEEFHFKKPVNTKGLRVSFAGNYAKGVSFDENALSTCPSDTTAFKCGVAVTGALAQSNGVDDGTVNDWFTVTQVNLLHPSYVKTEEKLSEQDQKAHEKYLKEVEKEQPKADNCGCAPTCDIDTHPHSTEGSSKTSKRAPKEAAPETSINVSTEGKKSSKSSKASKDDTTDISPSEQYADKASSEAKSVDEQVEISKQAGTSEFSNTSSNTTETQESGETNTASPGIADAQKDTEINK